MTDRIETTIEDEAALHEFVPAVSADEPPHCTCGEWCDSGPSAVRVRANFNQHQALAILAALKAARIALVELPKAGVSSDDSSVWHVGNHTINHYLGGDVVIDDRLGIDEEDAKGLAAVLLDATDAAEVSQ